MIQISYQPAYDPYHTAFRLLRLTSENPEISFKIGQLKILDFYLSFPTFLDSIKGFARKSKALDLDGSFQTYADLPLPIVIFRQMSPIQDSAIQTLCLRGVFEKDLYLDGFAKFNGENLSVQLSETIAKRNTEQRILVEFLLKELGTLSFEGHNGLKYRTGLLEYRYDLI